MFQSAIAANAIKILTQGFSKQKIKKKQLFLNWEICTKYASEVCALLLFYILFLNEFYNNLKMVDVHNTGEKEVTFIDFILLTGHQALQCFYKRKSRVPLNNDGYETPT